MFNFKKRGYEDLNGKILSSKKFSRILPAIILVLVVGLSMGYSALSTNMTVQEFITKVRIRKDIRITGFSVVNLPQACTIVSGSITTHNSEIDCSGERFYVLDTYDNYSYYGDNTVHPGQVKVVAKKNIQATTTNPKQFTGITMQKFSNTQYWGTNFKNTLGQTTEDYFSTSVYNNNSNLYQYVNAYQTYLRNNGVSSARTYMLNKADISSYGIGWTNDHFTDTLDLFSGFPFTITAPVWTGVPYDNSGNLYTITGADSMSNLSYSSTNSTAILPTVVMNESEVYTPISSGGVANLEYNSTHIGAAFNLTSTTKATFAVDITNLGNVEMALTSISGLPSGLKYDVSNDYYLGEKICEGNSCKNGVTKTIYISIYGTPGTYDLDLTLNFSPVYSITYNNITDSVGHLPTYAAGNMPLEIQFWEDVPPVVLATMGNTNISSSYQNDGSLEISNVTGNIEITKKNDITVPGTNGVCSWNGSLNTIGTQVTCGTESFYVVSSNSSNISMLAAKPINPDETTIKQADFDCDRQTCPRFSTRHTATISGSTWNLAYWLTAGTNAPAFASGYSTGYLDEDRTIRGGDVVNSSTGFYAKLTGYQTYLTSIGVTNATVSLLSRSQLSGLNCYTVSLSCANAPAWVKGYDYWTGVGTNYVYASSPQTAEYVLAIWSSGSMVYYSAYNREEMKIRPTVTLPVSFFDS